MSAWPSSGDRPPIPRWRKIWSSWGERWSTRGPCRGIIALLLDTSVLIGGTTDPAGEVAISAVSIAELHFGVLVARDEEARATRLRRLAVIEDVFEPLPFDATVARECGRLHAAVAQRGGKPRRRAFDLAIAATANVHGVPLLTADTADFGLIEDLVDLRSP